MSPRIPLLTPLLLATVSLVPLSAAAQVPITSPQPYPQPVVPLDPTIAPGPIYPRVAIRDQNSAMYICSQTPSGYADCIFTDESGRANIPNPDGNTYNCAASQGTFYDCYLYSTDVLTPNNKVPEFVPEPIQPTVVPIAETDHSAEETRNTSFTLTDVLIETGIEVGLGILWGTATFYWLDATISDIYYHDEYGYKEYDPEPHLGNGYAVSQVSLLFLNTALYGSAVASYEYFRYGVYPWEPYAGAAAGSLLTLLIGTMSGAIDPNAEPWVTTVFGSIFPAAGALVANFIFRKDRTFASTDSTTFILPTLSATPSGAAIGIVGRF